MEIDYWVCPTDRSIMEDRSYEITCDCGLQHMHGLVQCPRCSFHRTIHVNEAAAIMATKPPAPAPAPEG